MESASAGANRAAPAGSRRADEIVTELIRIETHHNVNKFTKKGRAGPRMLCKLGGDGLMMMAARSNASAPAIDEVRETGRMFARRSADSLRPVDTVAAAT